MPHQPYAKRNLDTYHTPHTPVRLQEPACYESSNPTVVGDLLLVTSPCHCQHGFLLLLIIGYVHHIATTPRMNMLL
jgi:hypothetical protein